MMWRLDLRKEVEMSEFDTGRLLAGDSEKLKQSVEAYENQPVDLDLFEKDPVFYPAKQRTIENAETAQGAGTFSHKAITTIRFEPHDGEGWWFDRADLPDYLPTRVSVRDVWTTGYLVSNIVLRSGPPSNYIRIVEHIIALKLGLGIDNLMIRIDSGDPPLFVRGSLALIEAIDRAKVRELDRPARYLTVGEPVTIMDQCGGFLTLMPADPRRPILDLDCAIDFNNAIGKQRIKLTVTDKHFRYGAESRTNTTAARKFYCQTIGKLFADVRNLGYSTKNILIAGKKSYVNEPKLMHGDKSLEAVWHRALLDLLAALSLVEEGRFVGRVASYKAGHGLDVKMITKLYLENLLVDLPAEKD